MIAKAITFHLKYFHIQTSTKIRSNKRKRRKLTGWWLTFLRTIKLYHQLNNLMVISNYKYHCGFPLGCLISLFHIIVVHHFHRISPQRLPTDLYINVKTILISIHPTFICQTDVNSKFLLMRRYMGMPQKFPEIWKISRIGISFYTELNLKDGFDNWKQVFSERYKFSNDVN